MEINEYDSQTTLKEKWKFHIKKDQIMSKAGENLFRQGLISLQEKQKFDEIINHRSVFEENV